MLLDNNNTSQNVQKYCKYQRKALALLENIFQKSTKQESFQCDDKHAKKKFDVSSFVKQKIPAKTCFQKHSSIIIDKI